MQASEPAEVSIREAVVADVAAIVSVHSAAFPRFLMTLLGPRFLRTYYESVLRYAGTIFLVSSGDGRITGFAAGFVDPGGFYRAFGRVRHRAMLAALPYCALRPWIWPRLLESGRQVGLRGRNPQEHEAELASIAVVPAMAGSGIGHRLLDEFILAARARGASSIKLTTDAAANDRVNRFYERAGFMRTSAVARGRSRIMNEYAYYIDGEHHE